MTTTPLLFALEGSRDLGGKVAKALGAPLADHEERSFEDGEHKARALTGVRGRDVYVLHSLYRDAERSVNDKLCQLLFFIGAIKDAGAARVTAVLPYLAYARKDRRTKTRDPVTSRYLAQLLEAVGTDCVAALEVHNRAAFDNAFRCRSEHLVADALFIEALRETVGDQPIAVVSPDAGGTKRVDRFRDAWEKATGARPPSAFLEKRRSEGRVTGDAIVGDVSGRAAVIVDDLIASGTTLLRAVEACHAQGASNVYALATHGLFAPGAERLFVAKALKRLWITDSVATQREDEWQGKVTVLSVADMLGAAITALHDDTASTFLET